MGIKKNSELTIAMDSRSRSLKNQLIDNNIKTPLSHEGTVTKARNKLMR